MPMCHHCYVSFIDWQLVLSAIQNAGYTYKALYGREHGYLKNCLLPIVSTQPVYSGRVDISGSPLLNIVTFSVAILIHQNNINTAPLPHWKGCICPGAWGCGLWFVICLILLFMRFSLGCLIKLMFVSDLCFFSPSFVHYLESIGIGLPIHSKK